MNQKVQKTWKRGISLREYCVKNHMEYLLDEWDKKKNKNLMPEDIGPKSHKKIWWLLSYDDKKQENILIFRGRHQLRAG